MGQASASTNERLRYGCFYNMADIIPVGVSGPCEVDHFRITKDTFQGFGVERTRPGLYARLKVLGGTMMSDTDMELRTNYEAVRCATGDVLIGGLGLGMITLPIVLKPEVSSVTVVEISRDVIALVEPHIRAATGMDAGKLTVIHADVKRWKPTRSGRQFDFAYFDIWEHICIDDLQERKDLHVAVRRYLRKGGRATSWEFERMKSMARRGDWR